MKPTTKSAFLRVLPWCALTLLSAGSASAQLLFLDNFNTAALGDGNFNNDIATDQSGTAATKTYTTVLGGGWDGAYQRGNGGTWLMYAGTGGFGSSGMQGSLNYDIADAANTLGTALEISFNMSVSNPNGDSWASFTVGNQNPFVTAPSVGFGSIFRDGGETTQFSNGPDIGGSATFIDNQQIKFVFSDATGSGSAFSSSNGANDVVKMYVNGSLTNTFTGLDLDAADQYISFHANNVVANIDNLTITALSAADPFLAWINATWPSLSDKTPAGDPDNDGIANLVEYVLQGGDPSVSTTGTLPTLDASGPNFVFTYYRRAAATGTTQVFQYSPDLGVTPWINLAIPGGAGVTVIADTPTAGIDKVEITVAKGAETKLFGRLQVVK